MLKKLQQYSYRLFMILFASVYFSCSLPSDVNINPKIKVTFKSENITPGQTVQMTSYSGNPENIIFIVENTGISNLVLYECDLNSHDFSILNNMPLFLSENEKCELKIVLSSQKMTNFTQVKIQSNDPDNNEFIFKINCIKSNIEVFFTGPGYDQALQDKLIRLVSDQNPNEYMDMCFYGFDFEPLVSEIENAIGNGIHVRFVGDLDGDSKLDELKGNYYSGYFRIAAALDKYFPVSGKKRTNFPLDNGFDDFILVNDNIMHNKFALFTDNSGNQYLFTGSANCTESDFMLNNNNSLLIRDSGITSTYREQFEYLLGLPGKSPVNEIRHLSIDNIPIDIIFPPALLDGKTSINHVLNIVNSAKSSIQFMIFSFTHHDLIDQLIKKYQDGIKINGVFDESQLLVSSEESLVRSGIPCRIDGNFNEQNDGHGGKLHHKTMILDGSKVITGSYNWSYSADRMNDENILIIHSKEIAGLYKNEWQKRWNEGREIKFSSTGSSEEYDYQDILISEVMWMGSRKTIEEAESRDEFIELKNNTGRAINLNGWSLEGAGSGGKAIFLENCSIIPGGYLVIMQKDPVDSAFRPDNYHVLSSLSISNTNLNIILKDPNGTIIDNAGNGNPGADFAGYSGITKKSMARNEFPGDGGDSGNWFTTNGQINISSDYSFILYNLATPGEDNQSGIYNYDVQSIVISEIAWAGTDASSNDEWIELYNNTNQYINLAGWNIEGSIDTELYGIISPYGHFLLERTDETTVPDKTADIIYTGSLNNSGAIIRLLYNNLINDDVDMQDGWAAGSNSPKITMERIDTESPSDSFNWKDGQGDIEGAQNSLE